MFSFERIEFPDPSLSDKKGLVCIGGNLQINTLISAYSTGVFPWYNPDEPILWWCPDPRFVLYPNELYLSKSLRKLLKKKPLAITFDTSFESVIRHCAEVKRSNQEGTWLTEEMIDAYSNLHKHGLAHSVEVWDNQQLVGGLYGVAMGSIFFGESMFSLQPNASKYAFVHLCRHLAASQFTLIDCQIYTNYLESFGARFIDRQHFLDEIHRNNKAWTASNWSKIGT